MKITASAKLFEMHRRADQSGVSGTGKVGEGVVFSDGTCVFRWLTEEAPRSTVVYKDIEDFRGIHIDPHPENGTELVVRCCGAHADAENTPGAA